MRPLAKKRHREQGFSLIELMVVLLVIGLTAGVVVMTWPRGEADVEARADRFAADMRRAVQTSILSGRLLGLSLRPDGYAVLRYERGRWTPSAQGGRDQMGGPWGESVTVTIDQAGERRAVSETPELTYSTRSKAQEAAIVPDVIIDPIGMVTPFAVRFEAEGREIVVSGDAAGEVTVRHGAGW